MIEMSYGKDGTFYKDWKEMKRADEKWLQQDKQNKLIQEQNKMKAKELAMREKENKLLQEQNKLMKQQEEEQRRQYEEQKRHNQEIEMQKSMFEQFQQETNLNEMDDDSNNNNTNEVTVQQFNMSKENIDAYIDRGMMCLEDEEYEKANKFFEMVLDIEPKTAQAHLGKFLASYNVSSLNDLQDKAIFDLEDSKDFMRALKYSEGENKELLQKFLESNKVRIEKLEKEEKENSKKIQELCKKLEENYQNMQKENLEIVQELFYQLQEEIQKNEKEKHGLEMEIVELEGKLKSLGFFKAKEKESVKNEIENKKSDILKIKEKEKKRKEEYKKEIKNLCEQEKNLIKELEERANDPIMGEQIKLTLQNLGVENEGEEDPSLDEAIELVIKSGEASTAFIQRRLKIGYTRARKNSRSNGT